MVWSVVKNFQKALKYRGGWKGLIEHMYTNGDYPFKYGTYRGCDAAGNRYYENRVDYPFGQHRWVEPGDIHNFDATSVPPEWHGWMCSIHDDVPSQTDEYITEKTSYIEPMCKSDANIPHNVGHQEEVYNFHHLHNQSQIRSRGYGIGNPIVGLPPFARDAYYTQPGSPYNDASIRPTTYVGTTKDGTPYKSEKWRMRLMSDDEREAEGQYYAEVNKRNMEQLRQEDRKSMAIPRGAGTVLPRKK